MITERRKAELLKQLNQSHEHFVDGLLLKGRDGAALAHTAYVNYVIALAQLMREIEND